MSDKKFHILEFDKLEVIDRGNGVKTRLLVNHSLGSENLTSGYTRFEPDAKIAVHWHNCDESVFVVEGDAIAEVDGQRIPMKAMDTTFVKAGVPHRFVNESDKPMAILFTYASGHVTRTFADTGVTVEHLSPGDRASAPQR